MLNVVDSAELVKKVYREVRLIQYSGYLIER